MQGSQVTDNQQPHTHLHTRLLLLVVLGHESMQQAAWSS